MFPRGSIVRQMRLTDAVTTADGAKRTRTISAPGIVVRLRGDHPNPTKPPAKMRADFLRYCRSIGAVSTAVEFLAEDDSGADDLVPTAYQVMGEPAALECVVDHYAVADWHFAINQRIPWSAAGAGTSEDVYRAKTRQQCVRRALAAVAATAPVGEPASERPRAGADAVVDGRPTAEPNGNPHVVIVNRDEPPTVPLANAEAQGELVGALQAGRPNPAALERIGAETLSTLLAIDSAENVPAYSDYDTRGAALLAGMMVAV